MAAHRYWRIYTTASPLNLWVGIIQVKMYDVMGGANLSLYPTNGTGTASSSNGALANECYVDSSSTGWKSQPGQPLPQWTCFDFGAGAPRDIIALTLLMGQYAEYSPSDFKVQSSDDYSTWTDVASLTYTSGPYVTQAYYIGTVGSIGVAVTAPVATLTAFGGGNSLLPGPMPTVQFHMGGAASLQGPAVAPIVAFSGASSATSGPPPTLRSSGHNSYGEQAAFLIAPPPSLTITTGANGRMTAPSPTLAAAGTVTGWAKATITAPTATLSAAGKVSAMASADLSAPSPNLIGYGGAVCSVTLTGKATVQATGNTGVIGGAQITCPLFRLSASGTAQNYGSANLIAPSAQLGAQAQAYLIAPGARLTAIGTATVTATYEAYAVNLNHRDPASNNQVTRYTNYPFDRIVRYKNSYFGMNSTGLYLLEGTTDNATPIAYDVKTHVTDFDATEQKTVVSAYMGGRMGAAETVTLFAGEKTANAYPYTTPRGATPQNYRQKFGRGIKARYYGIGFKGDKEFDLDTLELEINKLPRRI